MNTGGELVSYRIGLGVDSDHARAVVRLVVLDDELDVVVDVDLVLVFVHVAHRDTPTVGRRLAVVAVQS